MNVYISFWTTSEPAPDVRAKSSVSSKTGVWIAPVAVERAEALHLVRHAPPERLLGREDVVGAARPLDLRHARSSARNGLRASSSPSVVAGPWPE